MLLRHPRSTLFPYTTLFRSIDVTFVNTGVVAGDSGTLALGHGDSTITSSTTTDLDRKSTRLNSSHANISYAVSCLKIKINDGVQQVDGSVNAGATHFSRSAV